MPKKRIVFSFLVLVSLLFGFFAYQLVWANNIQTHEGLDYHTFTLSPNSNVHQVVEDLKEQGIIKRKWGLSLLAKRMNLAAHIYPGEYHISRPMSNKQLVQLLRQGASNEFSLTIIKTRTLDRFAGHLGKQFINVDSLALKKFYQSPDSIALLPPLPFEDLNLTKDNVLATVIPNTYNFYKDASLQTISSRLLKEYIRFWNGEERLLKAETLGLKPLEVIILASIVEEESIKSDERPTIAGLYLNRIKKGWKLQADPTIKFALQRFELKRILFSHIDEAASSPYSTYAHFGLPPGPICIPSQDAIGAVLNAETHDFMYMCAKDDMSGYHAFAKTKSQHDLNAARYHAALNAQK